MATLDLLVFIFVLILTGASVLWGQKRKNKDSMLDHLIMGRQLTLPLFVFTLVATWYGGIYGVAQIAFEKGLYNFLTQGVFWYASYLTFAFFVLPRIKQEKYITLPSLVSGEIGPVAGGLAATFNVLNLIPIAYTISIGLFLDQFLHWGLFPSSALGMLVVLSYSLFGGFRSVVYSDLIQFFVMILSVVLVLGFSFYNFGTEPLETLPTSFYNPLEKNQLSTIFMWGLIAFATLIDPNFYQRSYAAKNIRTAKRGIIIATIIWMVFDICLTLGAMYAAALMPEADPKNGYFVFAMDLLPNGLKGLFLAGILATILSTLDSYLFLGGTTFNYDIMKSGTKRNQFLSVFSLAFISLIISYFFDGKIEKVWSMLGSLSTSALLVPMMFYFKRKELSEVEFIFSSLTGILGFALAHFMTYSLEPIYYGVGFSLLGYLALKFR